MAVMASYSRFPSSARFRTPTLLLLLTIPTAIFAGLTTEPPQTVYSGTVPITTLPPMTFSFQDPSGNTILRPSSGETITAGLPYTITWTDKVGAEVQFNLDDSVGNSISFGKLCDGWLINAYCGKLNNKTQNTGSWVWNIPLQPDYYNSILVEYPQTYWLVLQVVPTQGEIWEDGAPFQRSSNFSIVNLGWESSSSSSSRTISSTSTSSVSSTKLASSTTTPAGLVTTTTGKTSTPTQGAATPTSTGAALLEVTPVFWPLWIFVAVALLY